MSKSIMLLAALGLVTSISACGRNTQQEEFIVVDPEPISVEPVYTGKYK